ncbi:MAG: 2-succinyl-5-enolpyruvyl-6-hydroxy-3-cyclohexene-1-carboxylic-acid synthase [Bacteroidales bacterium]|nr:2-succinyl-5-enolpyruvyl-6-hydroxy-3-cyclohexene-1-carboxylic-acid synthase [Bacteroidales bacterium]
MHSKQHIADLPAILYKKGVAYVIISPGSRNAPLINSFLREFGDKCISIIDERSAGYIALGIACFSGIPVVMLCTSGTAALNYAPAIAEAFHQGVPLIAITADRPPEWIDQQDNQTIRQEAIYASNCKASFTLPVEVSTNPLRRHAQRIVNEAYNIAVAGRKGPVHINIPLREPLYEDLPVPGEITCISISGPAPLGEPDQHLIKTWREAKKILIVAGQQPLNVQLTQSLEIVGRDKRVCIIGEPVSNITAEAVVRNPELVLAVRKDNHDLDPDLILYFGGQVVSNRLKKFLRDCRAKHCWFIDIAGRHVDTFNLLTDVIRADPALFFAWLARSESMNTSGYKQCWQVRKDQSDDLLKPVLGSIDYSDLGIIQQIIAALPQNVLLFAGNSSIIRYISFFSPQCREIYCNRGVSGIDGCVSTAAGIAVASNETVMALVGDQSFVYDSNALWNRSLPENLKIIVINNQGGGIFSLLEGPSSTPAFKAYLEAHHPVEIGKLAEAFHVSYFACRSYADFNTTFNTFVRQRSTAVYEIFTPGEVNPVVFRNFVSHLMKPT